MSRVLNFGSLNLDYVYAVDHFVRPGETTSALERKVFCGGKGLNQSIALARAGAEVSHAGAVGAADGGPLLEILRESGVDVSLVAARDCASGHAIIQVDASGQNCILLYGGANTTITEKEIDRALSSFGEGDFLLLQNEVIHVDAMMRKAKARGMKIVFNPSPMDAKIAAMPLELCDYLLLNEIEAGDLCGVGEGDLLERICKKFPQAAVVLTMGKEGACYFAPSLEMPLWHGIYQVPVVDTTAAGDTFTGYFLAAIAGGKSVEWALQVASKAAAIAVSRPGAAPSIPCMRETDEIILNVMEDRSC